jgi:SOS response regulatory protein OraA/RecX
MKGTLTDKRKQEVSEEMQDLGYDCDGDLVERVLNWHRENPLPNDAALAANILDSLQKKGVTIA